MHAYTMDRRSGIDRRRISLRAYWHGARNPRRRNGRRASDSYYPIVDWHPARVFALAVGILALCVADGVLTIMLMSRGAIEANPFMALFVPHNLGWFAAIKLTLTSVGALVLVACSRMKLFRAIPGEAFLAAIFLSYVTLIVYELRLMHIIPE